MARLLRPDGWIAGRPMAASAAMWGAGAWELDPWLKTGERTHGFDFRKGPPEPAILHVVRDLGKGEPIQQATVELVKRRQSGRMMTSYLLHSSRRLGPVRSAKQIDNKRRCAVAAVCWCKVTAQAAASRPLVACGATAAGRSPAFAAPGRSVTATCNSLLEDIFPDLDPNCSKTPEAQQETFDLPLPLHPSPPASMPCACSARRN